MEIEQSLPPPGCNQRPADVLVHGPEEGSPTTVDTSVVHALQSSDSVADVHPGKQARLAELRKVRESAAACRRAGWLFCPMVLETVGAWGGRARHLTQALSCRLSLVWHCSRKEAVLTCRGRIAAALIRQSAGSWSGAFR